MVVFVPSLFLEWWPHDGLAQVEADQVIAKEKGDACAEDEAVAKQAAAEANAIKTDCQKDLDEALPEYYAAVKSLEALDKKDIQEIKSFAKPPALVEACGSLRPCS
eukprot:6470888-Amphidinium_carterae.2